MAKIQASEIVANLNFTGPDGKPIIPPGSLVYLSTDDPDGICKVSVFVYLRCTYAYVQMYVCGCGLNGWLACGYATVKLFKTQGLLPTHTRANT